MRSKEYRNDEPSHVALVLRLSKPWGQTIRVVYADAAFASVASTNALRKYHGLYYVGYCKTAHKNFTK